MDLNSLSQEELKLAQSGVRQDVQYVKSRKMLFVASVTCSVGLAAIGYLLSKDLLTMEVSSGGILACVTTYVYFLINMVQQRKHAENRWLLSYEQSRKPRKERRGEKKARRV